MSEKYPLLASISSPEDLRRLEKRRLPELAAEIRSRIIDVVSRNGGHLASNLGAVELTMALHLSFDSPRDKIIWDVGHQCYTHKILTGRNSEFGTLRQSGGVSGFPKPSESIHDIVETGHSSTSISAALGVLTGQELLETDGAVIAVIGDGAMTGGMAFEALNHAGHLKKQLIVVLNDNAMSIHRNVGALSVSRAWMISNYLSRLAATTRYQRLRDKIDRGLQGLPLVGMKAYDLVVRLKRGVKAVLFKESIFSDLGFEYVGPIDGHSISRLTDVFTEVRTIGRPTVVHVATQKGRGYEFAEGNPTLFHGIAPFTVEDGKLVQRGEYTFTRAFASALADAALADERITAVTAAMARGTGLNEFQERCPTRFFDVGIAEQHALTFAAGQARSGCRPVVAVYSTFMQRAVDQIVHDIALPRLPVVMALDRSGVVGDDGETHQGVYDIPLFRTVPNLTILAPGCREEMQGALNYALTQAEPVIIRYPKASAASRPELAGDWRVGAGALIGGGKAGTLIVCTGGLLDQALAAAETLRAEGTSCDVYNLRFIKPLDETRLAGLFNRYRRVVAFEDGAVQGGAGEALAALVLRRGCSCRFSWFGVPDKFYSQASRDELLAQFGLDARGVAETVRGEVKAGLTILRREA